MIIKCSHQLYVNTNYYSKRIFLFENNSEIIIILFMVNPIFLKDYSNSNLYPIGNVDCHTVDC